MIPPPSERGAGAPPPPPRDPLSADREALREPSRVSPVGPVFLAWALLRRLGVINIGIITVLAGFGNFELVALGGSMALAIAGLARWLRFTYHLETTDDGDQLVTLSGVVSRTRTVVPLDRVQSVSTRQNPFHRLVGLVEVSVETAGSAGAEVQLSAVRPIVAQRLRRLSTATSTSGEARRPVANQDGDGALSPPPPPDATPLLRRTTGDILRIAFSRNPLLLLAPIPLTFGLLTEADELVSGLSGQVEELVAGIGGSVPGIIVLVLVVVTISAAVSLTLVVLRLHDLRLVVEGAGLRTMSGLLSRTETTASIERVQALSSRRNPLERWFGHHDVELALAGAGNRAETSASNSAGGATSLRLPGTTGEELEAVADIVLGDAPRREVGHAEVHGISPLAVQRWTVWFGFAPAAVAVAALWWFIGSWALLGLAWVPVAWRSAVVLQRSWRWSFGPETLRIESGFVTRSRLVMPVRKTQNVMIKRGIFHRRNGLADLYVRTAGRVQLRLPMLPLEQAQAVRDELLLRAETDPRPFM